MVTKVKIRGLHKKQAKGKWYVTIRATGETLVKGFEGSKQDLEKYLSTPDFLLTYSSHKTIRITYPEGSLGKLIEWFKTSTDRWDGLGARTKSDYEKAFAWIGQELNYPYSQITRADIVRIVSKATKEKWPKFGAHLKTALSSVFSEAVEHELMEDNPCLGVKSRYKPKKEANREWRREEEETVLNAALPHVRTILLLAREVGMRGEDIHALKWSGYDGTHIEFVTLKNQVRLRVPVSPRLKEHLDTIERNSIFVVTGLRGQPYTCPDTLQSAAGKHIRAIRAQGTTGDGLTLHGLRVTLAAEFKRMGYSDRQIADIIGDESESMGAHYSRHVERTDNVTDAFKHRNTVVQNG